jgi:hypothetical protein
VGFVRFHFFATIITERHYNVVMNPRKRKDAPTSLVSHSKVTTLPWKITLDILKLTAGKSQSTAARLCLLSSSIRAEIAPILWRHVTLTGTEQIKQFITAIRRSRRPHELLQGITLLDTQRSREDIDRESTGWQEHWTELILMMDHLSTKQNLTTLVLSRDACRRLEYVPDTILEDLSDKQLPLEYQMRRCNFTIKNVVISHGDIPFYLQRMNITNLTWFGCEREANWLVSDDEIDDYKQPFGTKALKDLKIFISDRINNMYPTVYVDDWDLEGDCEEMNNNERQQRHCDIWTFEIIDHLRLLFETQKEKPKIHIALHRKTLDAKIELLSGVEGLRKDRGVTVGSWGNSKDQSQEEAVIRQYAKSGWIHKTSNAYHKELLIRYTEQKQWCSCRHFPAQSDEIDILSSSDSNDSDG